MSTDLIPAPNMEDGGLESHFLDHSIRRQMAGQPVPAYVIGDREFVGMVRRLRLPVKRDARGAYCELDWPTVVQVRAGGPKMEWFEIKLEER